MENAEEVMQKNHEVGMGDKVKKAKFISILRAEHKARGYKFSWLISFIELLWVVSVGKNIRIEVAQLLEMLSDLFNKFPLTFAPRLVLVFALESRSSLNVKRVFTLTPTIEA